MCDVNTPTETPTDLAPVLEFLNSWRIPNDTRVVTDELPDLLEQRERWTDRFPSLPSPPTDLRGQDELTSLRDVLRDSLGQDRPTSLQAAIDRHRWSVEITAEGSPKVRIVADGEPAAADLLRRVIDAVRDGYWGRVRACPDCRWVFYDSSRNGRRRWCSMTAEAGARGCGSIAKTRSYRARHAAKDVGAAQESSSR